MTFWQENYSFIKEVYDTRYTTTIRDKREWFRVQELNVGPGKLKCCEIIFTRLINYCGIVSNILSPYLT